MMLRPCQVVMLVLLTVIGVGYFYVLPLNRERGYQEGKAERASNLVAKVDSLAGAKARLIAEREELDRTSRAMHRELDSLRNTVPPIPKQFDHAYRDLHVSVDSLADLQLARPMEYTGEE